MKFIKSPKGAVTTLMILLLIVSCFWIVKSEIRAASLQSQLEEHHKQLKNNSDALDQVSFFMRKAGNNFILIDDQFLQLGTGKSVLQFKGDLFNVNIRSGKLLLELSEPDKLVQLINENSKIKLKNDNIKIETKGDLTLSVSADKDFGYNKDEDYIYLRNEESRLTLGEIFGKDQKSLGKGIDLISKTGGPYLTVKEDKIMLDARSKNGKHQLWLDPTKDLVGLRQGNSKIMMRRDSVTILGTEDISIGPSIDKSLGYRKNEDKIYMQYGEAILYLGELLSNDGKSLGNGIYLRGKTGGPVIAVRDNKISLEVPSKDSKYRLFIDPVNQLVGMRQGDSKIYIEKETIKIEAFGDINITSKNGKVNINGKR